MNKAIHFNGYEGRELHTVLGGTACRPDGEHARSFIGTAVESNVTCKACLRQMAA